LQTIDNHDNCEVRFIKRLTLQGYKTFASHTEFVFGSGVTAVVGPNGSGKSNIADSLRWVLGEQSYGTLRGKRTEDMIFSGSEQRARLGMAFVALTFDNATGWLPIDFAEVEIARRAYRSGENEYYLNGNRVRLRDIAELLGTSGLSERTYTVIGQGLVDQALSQRPEERRKLFEEAAGITVHQSKREQAAQKLLEANTNLTRARDIVSELTPRLRYLKAQARRAQEYRQIKNDLDAQLRVWYGFKWQQASAALLQARERLADYVNATAEQSEAVSFLMDQIIARQAERAALQERLGDWHRDSGQLHRQAEGIQRELAVRSEQLRLWSEQSEDLERELVLLRVALEDGNERLRAAEAYLAEAQTGHAARAGRVIELQQDLDTRDRQRQAAVQRNAEVAAALAVMKTQLAERQIQVAQVADRRAELARVITEQKEAAQAAATQITEFETELEQVVGEIAAVVAELAQLEQARQVQAAALTASQTAERRAAEELNAAQRWLARLQDQRDLLARLRDEGAGLAAGPRAILLARQNLEGIVGALGDLIDVPAELERAVEAALGGRLQDIVVRSWNDAEAAVTFLKERRAGRATFLPLDTLRRAVASDVPALAGVRGRASDLVRCDPSIRPAVELALNRTLVVDDLPTAHLLLNRRPMSSTEGGTRVPATLVTLEGEIVRPNGSVTGGSDSTDRRDSGLLARARTLRSELPGQIQDARTNMKAREEAVAKARVGQEAARSAIHALGARHDEMAASRERLLAESNRLQLAFERARQTHMWHEQRRQEAEQEFLGLDSGKTVLISAIADLTAGVSRQETILQDIRRELADRQLEVDGLAGELAQLRAETAVSARQIQDYRTRCDDLSALKHARNTDIAAKEKRVASLSTQLHETSQVISEQRAIGEDLADRINALTNKIEPAEARLAQIEREHREAEAQLQTLQEQLRHAQMRQSQGELAVQRAGDELTHLRKDIEKDLGLVVLAHDPEATGTSSHSIGWETTETAAWQADELLDSQPPLPLNGMVTRLPVVAALPDGLDNDVRNFRAQLARLGPVNLDALAEYEEVEARFNFLNAQAADLEKAVTTLEEVIVELDRVMEREFLSTFKAVADRFKEEFKNLFGGGAGRLVLTEPDSPSTTGVEIIARPPGKREQGLALLSGGERALTAAALIFSILKSRPTPFCVLDEVDATLDESNVGRFRDALKVLSNQTQFILITHNRGTIEIADTIYGVSMGGDNTSQVLSLKLHGREVVPATAAEID
jgi:chromosome segregation protein